MKCRPGLLALALGAPALLLCVVRGGDERRVAILDGRRPTLGAALRIVEPLPTQAELTPYADEPPAAVARAAGTDTTLRFHERVDRGVLELSALLATSPTLRRWERTAASLVKSWGPSAGEALLAACEHDLTDPELLAVSELLRQHAAAHTEGRLTAELERAFDRVARTRLQGISLDPERDPDLRLFAAVAMTSLGTITDSLAFIPRLDDDDEGERRRSARALACSPHAEVAHALDERLRNGTPHEIEAILVTLEERADDVEAWGPHMAAWLEAPLRQLVEDTDRPLAQRRRALAALSAWGPEAVAEVAEELLSDLSLGRDDELLHRGGRELLSTAAVSRDRLSALARDPALHTATRLSLLEALVRESGSSAEAAGLADELLALLRDGLDFESRRRAVYALAASGFDEERFAALPELADLQDTFARARRLGAKRGDATPR